MRQFGSSGFRLWNLGADAKTLYTAFCLLTFAGGGLLGALLSRAGRGRKRAGSVATTPGRTTSPTRRPRRRSPGRADGGTGHRGSARGQGGAPAARGGGQLPQAAGGDALSPLHHAGGAVDRRTPVSRHGVERARQAGLAHRGGGQRDLHLATPGWCGAAAGLAPLHALSGIALTVTMSVLTLYPVAAMWRRPGPGAGPVPGPVIGRRVGPEGGAADAALRWPDRHARHDRD